MVKTFSCPSAVPMEMETYHCQVCGQDLPLMNKTIHELRCRGSKQKESEDKTNDNKKVAIQSVTSPVVASQGISSAPPTSNRNTGSSSSSSSSGTDWYCPQCTVMNPINLMECSICGSIRPGLSSYRDRLIQDDNESLYTGGGSVSSRSSSSARFPAQYNAGLDTSLALEELIQSNDRPYVRGRGRSRKKTNNNNSNSASDRHQRALSQISMLNSRQLVGADVGMSVEDEIDSMTFEQLCERFQQPVRRVDETVIAALPSRIITDNGNSNTTTSSSSSSSSTCSGDSSSVATTVTTTTTSTTTTTAAARQVKEENCPICLAHYSQGEEVKSLPCQHAFHSACIECWLRMNHTCPVCKYSLLDNGRASSSRGVTGNGVVSSQGCCVVS